MLAAESGKRWKTILVQAFQVLMGSSWSPIIIVMDVSLSTD